MTTWSSIVNPPTIIRGGGSNGGFKICLLNIDRKYTRQSLPRHLSATNRKGRVCLEDIGRPRGSRVDGCFQRHKARQQVTTQAPGLVGTH